MSFEVMGGFCETCPKRTYSRCEDCHVYACVGCQSVHACVGHPFDRQDKNTGGSVATGPDPGPQKTQFCRRCEFGRGEHTCVKPWWWDR